MLEISYNDEENIILVNRSGEISVEDLLSYIKKIDEDYRELQHLYILDDTTGSVSTFNHRDDYVRLVTELKKCLRNFVRVNVAIVADTPYNAALSDLYKIMTDKISNYFFRVFSTTEAATSWLKMRM